MIEALSNPDVQKFLILAVVVVAVWGALKFLKKMAKLLVLIVIGVFALSGFLGTEYFADGTSKLQEWGIELFQNTVNTRTAPDGLGVELLTTSGKWVDLRDIHLVDATSQPTIEVNGETYTLKDDYVLQLLEYKEALGKYTTGNK